MGMVANIHLQSTTQSMAPDKQPGKERIFLSGEKEQQGDYVFTATDKGEYRFCFDNSISTFSDKVVDFEISVHTNRPSGRLTHAYTVWFRSKTNPAAPPSRKKPAPAANNSAAWRSPSCVSPDRSRL